MYAFVCVKREREKGGRERENRGGEREREPSTTHCGIDHTLSATGGLTGTAGRKYNFSNGRTKHTPP